MRRVCNMSTSPRVVKVLKASFNSFFFLCGWNSKVYFDETMRLLMYARDQYHESSECSRSLEPYLNHSLHEVPDGKEYVPISSR